MIYSGDIGALVKRAQAKEGQVVEHGPLPRFLLIANGHEYEIVAWEVKMEEGWNTAVEIKIEGRITRAAMQAFWEAHK